jgi:hypothetical protein
MPVNQSGAAFEKIKCCTLELQLRALGAAHCDLQTVKTDSLGRNSQSSFKFHLIKHFFIEKSI